MRILIISFTDLSKREEREKCNEKAFVLVHPMPCCLFRWGFSIEFDLRTRKLPEKKMVRKVFIGTLWCQGRRLLGNRGKGAAAERMIRAEQVCSCYTWQSQTKGCSNNILELCWDENQTRHPSCFLYLLLCSHPDPFTGLDEVATCSCRKQDSPPSCAGDGVTSGWPSLLEPCIASEQLLFL